VTQTYWNGEPCTATRGTAEVADAPEFSMYWARDLVGQRIPVVRVNYFVHPFYLDDQDGRGWHKVTKGKGSPREGHRNVAIVQDSFQESQ
jgi:hypothetical protein